MWCYRVINVKNEARLRRKTATRRQKAKKWGGPAALNWHSTSKSKGNCRNRIDISKGNCQDSYIFLDTQCHIQLAAGAKIYRNVFNKISISKGNYQHFSKKYVKSAHFSQIYPYTQTFSPPQARKFTEIDTLKAIYQREIVKIVIYPGSFSKKTARFSQIYSYTQAVSPPQARNFTETDPVKSVY